MNIIKSVLNEKLIDKEKVRKNVIDKFIVGTSKSKKNHLNYNIKLATAFSLIIVIGILSVYIININNSNFNTASINNNSLNNSSNLDVDNVDESSDDISSNQDSQISLDNKNLSIFQDIDYTFVVYKGRVYKSVQTLNYETTINLKFNKLGISNKNYEAFNNEKNDFDKLSIYTSFEKGVEIYEIKNYDPKVRLLAYKDNTGIIFESFENIKINTFLDVANLLNIQDNIKYINVESAKENNSISKDTSMKSKAILNSKNNELFEAIKTANKIEVLEGNINFEKLASDFKKVSIKLKDSTNIYFTVYKEGYLNYNNIFFKIVDSKFNEIYNKI